MKNALLIVMISILGILIFGCKKNDSSNPISSTDLIVKQWKLVGLVNISDQQKYLNAVLEIKSNNNYIHTDNAGVICSQGIWKIESDYLILASTLFGNGAEPKYKILKLDSDTLKLQQHYTLDSKDSYLEYHYISKF